MTGPIYRFYMGKAKEPWYQLSKEEQNKLFARLDEALEQVGGRRVLTCDSAWAAGDLIAWGVDEFPDIEAIQKVERVHDELNWYRYAESWTLLGTKWE